MEEEPDVDLVEEVTDEVLCEENHSCLKVHQQCFGDFDHDLSACVEDCPEREDCYIQMFSGSLKVPLSVWQLIAEYSYKDKANLKVKIYAQNKRIKPLRERL